MVPWKTQVPVKCQHSHYLCKVSWRLTNWVDTNHLNTRLIILTFLLHNFSNDNRANSNQTGKNYKKKIIKLEAKNGKKQRWSPRPHKD